MHRRRTPSLSQAEAPYHRLQTISVVSSHSLQKICAGESASLEAGTMLDVQMHLRMHNLKKCRLEHHHSITSRHIKNRLRPHLSFLRSYKPPDPCQACSRVPPRRATERELDTSGIGARAQMV